MQIIVAKDYSELSKRAYDVLKEVVKKNSNAVLGLATGSSPIGLYKEMIADCKAGNVSYKNVKTVNLDEYIGLDISSDQSYVYFMRDNLFSHIDINLNNTYFSNGKAKDMDAECARYTELLNSMPADIQVLGIGSNGHIAFNEPGTSFDSTTHIVQLDDRTRKDNARFFATLNEVPTHAVTMGIKNILNAKKILVVANGESKADAVYKMCKGKVDESCPASVLQRHEDVTLVIDEKAASKL